MNQIKLYAACLILMAALPLALKAAPALADDSFFIHLHDRKAMANVTISAVHADTVEISIQLETVEELPLKAQAVSVTLSNPEKGIARAGAAIRRRSVDDPDDSICHRPLVPRTRHYARADRHGQHHIANPDLLNSGLKYLHRPERRSIWGGVSRSWS